MWRQLCIPLLTLGLFQAGQVPSKVSALEILRQVDAKYRSLRSYEFNGTLEWEIEVNGATYRNRIGVQVADASHDLVPDGALTMRFLRAPDTGWVKVAGPDVVRPKMTTPMPGSAHFEFELLSKGIKSASILRDENVRVNDQDVPCYVIEANYSADALPEDAHDSKVLLWVSKPDSLVLKSRFSTLNSDNGFNLVKTLTWAAYFDSYELNEQPPDWLRHAVKSADHEATVRTDLNGQAAPDFTLYGLDGRPVSLREFQGRVVLLNFWASWCGPCKQELPILERVERHWAPRGLVVLRITSEPPERVHAYFQKHGHPFPTLTEGDVVQQQFKVQGIPSLVLIDRSGRIAAYFVGTTSETELNSALQKAGFPRSLSQSTSAQRSLR